MKKTRIIAIALAVAVALMGAGYARWTQNITVNGTVNTGDLVVTIDKTNIPDSLVCKYWEGNRWVRLVDDPNDMDDSDGEVSKAKYSLDTDFVDISVATDKKSVSLTYNKFFPGLQAYEFYEITNSGTVPVKIEDIDFTDTVPTELDPYLQVVAYMDNNGVQTGTIKSINDMDELINVLKGYELLPNETVKFRFGAELHPNAPNDTQDIGGSFDFEIRFVQSNLWHDYQ